MSGSARRLRTFLPLTIPKLIFSLIILSAHDYVLESIFVRWQIRVCAITLVSRFLSDPGRLEHNKSSNPVKQVTRRFEISLAQMLLIVNQAIAWKVCVIVTLNCTLTLRCIPPQLKNLLRMHVSKSDDASCTWTFDDLLHIASRGFARYHPIASASRSHEITYHATLYEISNATQEIGVTYSIDEIVQTRFLRDNAEGQLSHSPICNNLSAHFYTQSLI